jgi:hypothetical protein
MSSKVCNGTTLTGSIPANGWLGMTEGWVTNQLSTISTNSYGVPLIGYEFGQTFDANDPAGNALGNTLIINANRDAKLGATYTTFLNWWAANVGGTSTNMLYHFNDAYNAGRYAWGALESTMQPISPLSSAPQKYQALMNYIGTTAGGTGTSGQPQGSFFFGKNRDAPNDACAVPVRLAMCCR